MDDQAVEPSQQGWAWAYRLLWREGSPARFGLKMVDTVLFTGGEPTTWLFTAKDGLVKKRNRDKTTLAVIREHFTRVALSDPCNSHEYVAVLRRMKGTASEDVKAYVLDVDGLASVLRDGADLSGAVGLQLYVHARGGQATRYRCELVVDRMGRRVSRVLKMVYLGGDGGGIRREATVPPAAAGDHDSHPAESAPVFALKSNMTALNRQVGATANRLLSYLEGAGRCTVVRAIVDFIVDTSGEMWFVGVPEALTTPAPARARRKSGGAHGRSARFAAPTHSGRGSLDISLTAGGAGASGGGGGSGMAGGALSMLSVATSRQTTSGALLSGFGPFGGSGAGDRCPGDYCDGFTDMREQARYLDGKELFSHSAFALDDPQSSGAGGAGAAGAAGTGSLHIGSVLGSHAAGGAPTVNGHGKAENLVVTYKSILQARLEREAAALADPTERRALLATGSARRLAPAHYYRPVRVCESCYQAYVQLDGARAQMAAVDTHGPPDTEPGAGPRAPRPHTTGARERDGGGGYFAHAGAGGSAAGGGSAAQRQHHASSLPPAAGAGEAGAAGGGGGARGLQLSTSGAWARGKVSHFMDAILPTEANANAERAARIQRTVASRVERELAAELAGDEEGARAEEAVAEALRRFEMERSHGAARAAAGARPLSGGASSHDGDGSDSDSGAARPARPGTRPDSGCSGGALSSGGRSSAGRSSSGGASDHRASEGSDTARLVPTTPERRRGASAAASDADARDEPEVIVQLGGSQVEVAVRVPGAAAPRRVALSRARSCASTATKSSVARRRSVGTPKSGSPPLARRNVTALPWERPKLGGGSIAPTPQVPRRGAAAPRAAGTAAAGPHVAPAAAAAAAARSQRRTSFADDALAAREASAAAAAEPPPPPPRLSIFSAPPAGCISALLELDDGTAMPYAVLGVTTAAGVGAESSAAPTGARRGAGPTAAPRRSAASAASLPPVDIVVLHDFFESADAFVPLLMPLLARPGKRRARALLFNTPGQAFSRFGSEGHGRPSAAEPFNNAFVCRALAVLLRTVRVAGLFGTRGSPLVLLGSGNGANVATMLALETAAASGTQGGVAVPVPTTPAAPTTPARSSFASAALSAAAGAGLLAEGGVRLCVLVNPFTYLDYHLDVVLQNWLYGVRAGHAAGTDLHLFLFSHLLFSERYLSRKTINGALEELATTPNPVSLEGRAAVCRGALAHRDLREHMGRLRTPTVLVQGRHDLLVRPEHAEPYLAANGGKASALREIAARGHGVGLLRVNCGHMVAQEAPHVLRRIVEAAIDDAIGTLTEADLATADE